MEAPPEGKDVITVSVSDGRNQPVVRKTTLEIASPPPARPTLSKEAKLKARELYLIAYKNEVDYQNYLKAIELYRQVLEMAPDPEFEYYKKAKARLELLRR
jgi:hypothetical protein